MLVAFGLRLHHLGTVPLRGDEAHTVNAWVELPLSETIARFATLDPHPPLAYALFNAWGGVMGLGEFAMRVLPAFFSLLGIPALYGIGSRLGGRALGLVAALLWALHPFQIWHAQDARNYAIWASLSALAVWAALAALQRRRLRDWLLYVLLATLAAYVYYLEAFILVALNAYVLLRYWWRWRVWAQWALAQVAIGAVLAPWYLWQFGQQSEYVATASGFNAADYLTRFLPVLNFGAALPGYIQHIVWQVLLLALLLALAVLIWRWRRVPLLPVLLGGVPLILLGLLSSRMDVFRPRYVLAAAPAYVLLWSALSVYLWRDVRGIGGRALALGCVAAWLGVSALGLHYYWSGPPKAPDWRSFTDYLEARAVPDDLIIQTATDAAFGYYYDGAARDIALPTHSEQPAADIVAHLAEVSQSYDSLWIVARTAPTEPNAGLVEAWAAENMQQVRQTEIDGLPIQQVMPWAVAADEIMTGSAVATFTDVVHLQAVTVSAAPEPTGELTVWLYWQPLGTTDDEYKVFLHLLDANGERTSQHDRFPQAGRIDTQTWDVGRLYRDVYALPDVLPGDYTLIAGLYDPQTGERLNTGTGDDYATLAAISIGP